MNGSTSNALVPLPRDPKRDGTKASCAGKPSFFAGRNKWFLLGAGLLAIAALALGSAVLGLAAVLPLLYVLPCFLMMVMCMSGHGKRGTSNDGDA